MYIVHRQTIFAVLQIGCTLSSMKVKANVLCFHAVNSVWIERTKGNYVYCIFFISVDNVGDDEYGLWVHSAVGMIG